ncbi:MAG: nucleotidyltransferase [Imperialibacter sp.]|uniref:nucleotidyltransferase n=1 Tax=Imperialibacter sp. TaxID=2038411 RepID=UPI0032F07272
MTNELPEFLRVIDSLNKHQVLYMVIGGFAVNYYGHSRATGDIDLYLKDSTENRQNLINAIESLGYGRFDSLLHVPMIAGYCEIMMDDGMYVDLMAQIPGIDPLAFDADLAQCETAIIQGVPVFYIGFRQLLMNKESTGRNKDLLDLEELRKIRKD